MAQALRDRDALRRGFDNLPDELKVHILEYALELQRELRNQGVRFTYRPLIDFKHRRHFEEEVNLSALLCINKSMRALAAQIYYGSSIFAVERVLKNIVRDQTGHVYFFPPLALGHWVRDLQMRLQTPTLAESPEACIPPAYVWLRGDWSRLLHAREDITQDEQRGRDSTVHAAPRQKSRTHWQRHFPSLATLRIKFFGKDLSPELSEAAQDAHKVAAIALRPRRVLVKYEPPRSCISLRRGETGSCEVVRDMLLRCMHGGVDQVVIEDHRLAAEHAA